jgi:hypothetical protein
MTNRPLLLLPLLTAALTAILGAFDLDAVRKEPNLEKRSELALSNADAALDRVRDAYQKGEDGAFKAALAEVSDSVVLCKQSLDESGKNARKRPKYFKKAEIGIRRLSRRLDNLQVEVSVDDRPLVEPVTLRAHQLQREILNAVMGKKD